MRIQHTTKLNFGPSTIIAQTGKQSSDQLDQLDQLVIKQSSYQLLPKRRQIKTNKKSSKRMNDHSELEIIYFCYLQLRLKLS